MIIAIDGPAGAGKSTIAKRVAQKLGIFYLDTGAMYRAFTFYILEKKVHMDDNEALKNALQSFNLTMTGDNVYVNGRDVTNEIRGKKVTDNVSYVSSLGFIRKKMVELQRNIGKNKDIVAEGRDIGTVVFNNTKYKFYLDAAVEERAKRRLHDKKNQSPSMNMNTIIESIEQRDNFDSTRDLSPLKKAPDALYIDSTHMSINAVTNFIINKVKDL